MVVGSEDFLRVFHQTLKPEDFVAFSRQYLRLKQSLLCKPHPSVLLHTKYIDLLWSVSSETSTTKVSKALTSSLKKELISVSEMILAKTTHPSIAVQYMKTLLRMKCNFALKRLFLGYFESIGLPLWDIIEYFYGCDIKLGRLLSQLYIRKWGYQSVSWTALYKLEKVHTSSADILGIIVGSAKKALDGPSFKDFSKNIITS
jgi:hypothetical protein